MVVMQIIDSLRSGGKERRLVQLINELTPKVQFVLVILSDNIHYKEIYDLKIPIYILKQRFRYYPYFSLKLLSIFLRYKPDIVQAWGPTELYYSVPLTFIMRLNLINSFIVDAPSTLDRMRAFTATFSFPVSRIIIANSYEGLKSYNAPKNKSICIYNGFSFERIKNLRPVSEVRSELNISTKFVVGMVASFHDYKDYDTYFKAAREILAVRNDVTFLAIGPGDKSSYKHELKGNKSIIIHDKIQHIEEYINIFTLSVLTTNSNIIAEGISNFIMESMALKKPVIATNRGGTRELVIDKETGFLIEPYDYKELSDKIIHLLNNKHLSSQLGEAGYLRIAKYFSLSDMGHKYLSIYSGIKSSILQIRNYATLEK